MAQLSDKEKIKQAVKSHPLKFYKPYVDAIEENNGSHSEYMGLCPLHGDKETPDFHVYSDGGWKCHACSKGGDIFDFYAYYRGLDTKNDFREIIRQVATEHGIKIKGKRKEIDYIPEETVEALHDNLLEAPSKMDYLRQERGLSEEVIKEYQLGFDGERYTIPVKDYTDKFVDIRRYDPSSKVKLLPWNTFDNRQAADKLDIELTTDDGNLEPANKGDGSATLYPKANLKKNPLVLVGGELDALRAESAGYNAVTNTTGENTWKDEWSHQFRDKDVTIALDNDSSGKKGTKKRVNSLDSDINSLELVQWPDDFSSGGDISDFLNHGNDTSDFEGLCRSTTPGYYVTPGTLEEAKDVYRKYYSIEDDSYIDIMFGVYIANRLDSVPIWLHIVGPPSSGKSWPIKSLFDAPDSLGLSSMTNQTLISGDKDADGDPSLLPKLDDKVLLIKDLTTVINKPRDFTSQFFGELRDAYDGESAQAFGTGEIKEYESKFGIITGTTSKIDDYSTIHAELGERFLKVRLPRPNSDKVAEKVAENMDRSSGKENKDREVAEASLKVVAQDFDLNDPPKVSPVTKKVSALARVIAYGRTRVKVGRGREIKGSTTPEAIGRLVEQLFTLGRGIALVKGKNKIDDEVHRLLLKVAEDTLLPSRVDVLKAIWNKSNDQVMVSDIKDSKEVSISKKQIRTRLKKFEVLEMVEKEKGGAGNADLYKFTPEFGSWVEQSGLGKKWSEEKTADIPF